MSLKAFHILFISAAILFSLGFSFWCFSAGADGTMATSLMGGLSALIGLGLLVYARWFVRKLGGNAQ